MKDDMNIQPDEPVEIGGDNAPAPEGGDLGDLTDEQLDALMNGVEADEDGNLPDAFPAKKEPKAEAEPEGDEEAEESAEEEAEEAEAESEDEAEADDQEEAVTPDMIRQVLNRVEVLELERDGLAAELERERLLRDRNAGKLGSLMQQLEKTKSATGDRRDEEEGDADERQPKTAAEEELREIRVERTQRAITGACQDFYTENIEFFEKLEASAGADVASKFQADLISRLQQKQAEFGEDISQMSPKLAAKVASTMIRSAYADMRIELMRDLQKQASVKSEKSRSEIRARKKGASGVRSKKAAAARVQSKTKSLSEMSDAELEAQLKAVASQLE